MLPLLAGVLAQSVEAVPSAISAGGTVAVAAIMYWRLSLCDKENRRLSDDLRANNDKTLAMAEKAIPALVEATRTLAEVKSAMDASLRPAPGGAELESLKRQMERLAEEMRRDR